MSNVCERYGCRRPAVRKFCSAKCRNEHIAVNRPRVERQTKQCENCGEEFVAAKSNARVCSTKCRVALHRASKTTVKAKRNTNPKPSTGVKVEVPAPKRLRKA